MNDMNEKELAWRETIRQMREEGYAVCVISPERMIGVDPFDVHQQMEEAADAFIEDMEAENNDGI